jgi:hypothetical protein
MFLRFRKNKDELPLYNPNFNEKKDEPVDKLYIYFILMFIFLLVNLIVGFTLTYKYFCSHLTKHDEL